MQVTQQDVVLVLCQVVMFVVLFAVLKRLWFGPIATVLHERESRSAGALAEAREIQARAEVLREQHAKELEEARAQARREMQEFWRTAEAEQQRLVEEARVDAERVLGEARARIGADVARARQELDEQVRVIARQAAQAVLGRAIG
jgi:F-type H+-transporting ATPase subunit b